MVKAFKKSTINNYHDRGKLNREVKVQSHDMILALKVKRKIRRALQRQLLHNSLQLGLQKKYMYVGAI